MSRARPLKVYVASTYMTPEIQAAMELEEVMGS